VDRQIRGLSPFPGAWFEALTTKGPVRVKALMSELAAGAGAPGQVLEGAGLRVACGEAAVQLLRVQREGKGPQDADEFLRGLSIGAQLA
jgi:methionyl-tRNA formyltransferase